jgi:4-amino-4-deoxy-L-arabinose transferase-like glycosyltransferase
MFPAPRYLRTASVKTVNRWDDVAAVALIVVLVAGVYGARLGLQPVVGEETRWATGAREMLSTGDWIVPRQQGQVFAERPPMTMWTMAVAGWLHGSVDPVAIRLPSVVAVLLTSLLLYYYGRGVASPFIGLAAALMYATMGQVLQIGRLGESEALFTFFVSASLLLWHMGHLRHWSPLATWCVGFMFAGLGALVKGPQAPVYFVTITAVYIAVRRDWHYLLRWQYAAGIGVFAFIVGLWQIPFYLATDWATVKATWSGLAADRIHFGGLVEHIFTYPLETFACLLPWSPLLVALFKRDTRELLANAHRDVATFLYTAILVAYPTVLLATGARGRYFMPLYPLVAVLIAMIVEQCSTAQYDRYPRRAWHQFLLLTSVLAGVAGVVIGFGGPLTGGKEGALHQPIWFCLAFGAAAAIVIATLWKCYRVPRRFVPTIAVLTTAIFVGMAYSGVAINLNAARWHNPAQVVADFKNHLPTGTTLVSLTPIEHRFAFYYEEPIIELPWPGRFDDLPNDVEYFCFMRNPHDTVFERMASRGRGKEMSSGRLPFAWEEVTSICVDRSARREGRRAVVLGRVVRPLRAEGTDATRPQVTTAIRSTKTER